MKRRHGGGYGGGYPRGGRHGGGYGGGHPGGGQRRGNTVPTNYRTLSVKNTIRNSRQVDHDRYHADGTSGRLELLAEVLDTMHIGTGAVNMLDKRLYLDIATTSKNSFCLPGAAVKGPVRSLFEVLSSSCDLDPACRPEETMCLACSLFGCLGYRGRVGFEEFGEDPRKPATFGIAKLPPGYKPNRSLGRRIYGAYRNEMAEFCNTNYGVLVSPTRLRGAMFFENVSERDLGLLFLSMGLDGTFTPKFGGGKHGGIGAVRLQPLELNKITVRERYRREAKREVLKGNDLGAWIKTLCRQAEEKLDINQKEALETIRQTLG